MLPFVALTIPDTPERFIFALRVGDTGVGSSPHSDIVVSNVPKEWFSLRLSQSRRVRIRILSEGAAVDGRAARVGQTFRNPGIVSHGEVVATFSCRPVAHGFDRPRYTSALKFAASFALGACLLVGTSFTPFATAASPTLNLSTSARHSTPQQTVAVQRDANLLAKQISEAFTRTGLRAVVTLVNQTIRVTGEATPSEQNAARAIVAPIIEGSSVSVVYAFRQQIQAVNKKVQAVNASPPFIVLADGRRLEPGDSLGGGWLLHSVSPEVVRARNGEELRDMWRRNK